MVSSESKPTIRFELKVLCKNFNSKKTFYSLNVLFRYSQSKVPTKRELMTSLLHVRHGGQEMVKLKLQTKRDK